MNVDRPGRPTVIIMTACHPFSWRDWKAFGTGTIGDMAAITCISLHGTEVVGGERSSPSSASRRKKRERREKYPQDNIVCYHIPGARTSCTLRTCKWLSWYRIIRTSPEVMKELWKEVARSSWGRGYVFVRRPGLSSQATRGSFPESAAP